MSGSRRRVKERDPKIVKMAMSLVGPIWAFAMLGMMANGSISFWPVGFSKRVDPTPLVLATLASLVLLAVVFVVLKIQLAAGKGLANLQAMSPDVFEDWVGARFREIGYSVTPSGAQGDHGVDLLAEKAGEIAVIQCKNFRSWSVGEPVLRDLFGAMHDFRADHAYLVTTGRLTQAALQWAKGKPITVWDGEKVAELSKQAARKVNLPLPLEDLAVGAESPRPAALGPAGGRGKDGPGRAGGLSPAAPAGVDRGPMPRSSLSSGEYPSLDSTLSTQPRCPKCGRALVERRNRTTGDPFLACPGYPGCRYTERVGTAT